MESLTGIVVAPYSLDKLLPDGSDLHCTNLFTLALFFLFSMSYPHWSLLLFFQIYLYYGLCVIVCNKLLWVDSRQETRDNTR